MNLPDFAVRRPVTVAMVFIGVVLLGFISWNRLPQELFPPITYPQITVVTSYEGAAPEEIETLLTKIIEEAVGTVANIKRISSTSKEGLSMVMAEFSWGTNMDFAALNVREKIDLVKERLPREASEPIVMKFNPLDLPIMSLSVTGEMSDVELRDISKRIIKDETEKVEGVASAAIIGGREREILVEVDQSRLQASGISLIEVVEAIKSANINYPAGTIKESFYEYLIRTMGEFEKIEEIKEVAVSVEEPPPSLSITEGGFPNPFEIPSIPGQERKREERKPERRLIMMRDIATVYDTVKERSSISRYKGESNVSVSIRRQSGANTLQVAMGVRKALGKLREELPPGVRLEVVYDQSTFIKDSITGVRDAAIGGGVLAFFVLLCFLRNIRSSLIVTTAIPISIMAVFSLMHIFGITLNLMSLGGLALGVGMLVDNAIVVIESIFRAKGSSKEAARQGTNEVGNAILASTLTTIAVFLPMMFVVGIAGQLFKELAFTVTFSLVASLVVALSLIPVLASRRSRRAHGAERMAQKEKLENTSDDKRLAMGKIGGMYPQFISLALKHKPIVLVAALGIFLASMKLLSVQDREFMPKVDQRQFIIKVDMPPGTKLEITDRAVRVIEKLLLALPETKDVMVNIGSTPGEMPGETLETMGSHQAQILVNLKKIPLQLFGAAQRGQRMRSTQEVVQSLKSAIEREDLGGVEVEYILQESVFGAALGRERPIAIEVKGHELAVLRNLALRLGEELASLPGIYGVKTTLIPPSPETKVRILKDRSSLYNLSVRDIALTANIALKGYVATKFKEEGREIDIRVRLRPQDRSDFLRLRKLLIHSPLGMEVPLSEVGYFSQGVGPTEIDRLDQQRAVVVSANIFKRSLSEVVDDINTIIRSPSRQRGTGTLKIPEGYTVTMGGEIERMEESFRSLRFALGLAILLVYMIMAAQFESLWQPFVIMFTLPLSLIGVSLALAVTHTSLNVVALLGVIMLGGIVVNNGIVLIDYVNILRNKGLGIEESIIRASLTRLRPILMTTLTTVLGLLPLALGFGEGSELRAPLAITVIGGLTLATFLTLVVIPVVYSAVAAHLPGRVTSTEPREVGVLPILPGEPAEEIPLPKPEPIFRPSLPISEKEEEEAKEATSISKIEPAEKPLLPEPPAPLSARQKALLEYLKREKMVTRKEYANKFKVSSATAARDLKDLVTRGLLIAKGPLGPGRRYELEE